MMDALARALNQQRHAIFAIKSEVMLVAARMDSAGVITPGKTTTVPLFRPEQVERLLRIEIDKLSERDWLEYLWRSGMKMYADPGAQKGPRTFQGVDVYIVDTLPAPGWRIVNPMVKP